MACRPTPISNNSTPANHASILPPPEPLPVDVPEVPDVRDTTGGRGWTGGRGSGVSDVDKVAPANAGVKTKDWPSMSLRISALPVSAI